MILSRHIATAHLPSCCTTCAALFFMTGRNTESLIVNANIQALCLSLNVSPRSSCFQSSGKFLKKYCSVLMSVLQISYCVQNIHCMLEAQAPTEVENVESSLGCQSTAISKCCLKSGHTELSMSTVLFLLPTGVALHD